MKIYFCLFLLIVLNVCAKRLACKNGGKPILTRTWERPYLLSYQCLCPFNYYGSDCNSYRDVLCYVQNSSISSFSPKITKMASLQFEMECFLKKLGKSDTNILSASNYYQLPILTQIAEKDYRDNNFYLNSTYQIIWANDSSLFDQNGELRPEDGNDTMADDEILDDYPEYTFDYSSSFFGVPIFDSKFTYTLTNTKFVNSSTELGDVEVLMGMKSFNELEKIIVGRLNATIQDSFYEYEVALLEFRITEHYGENHRVSHQTTMNTAKWRLFDPRYERGRQLKSNRNVPSWVWVVLIFLFLGAVVFLSKHIMKWYKEWKKRKQLERLLSENREE